MSIQPRTPLVARLRPGAGFVAVGFLALLFSCSGSDQVGYDVKLDFIPPTETNAADPLPDIVVPVALSPSNPSYNLGVVDTLKWTSDLRREAQKRRNGMEPGFAMSMDELSFTADGSVDFSVRVFSRNGYVSGRNRGYVPTSPTSCSFTLDPNTATGAEYAGNINQCLSDWISENGVPMRFDVEVTSLGASPATAATKAGFTRKGTATAYDFRGNYRMSSPKCDEGPCCDGDADDQDVLGAVEEGGDIFGLLNCSTLVLTGEGTIDPSQDPEDPVVNINAFGGADIWDACGTRLSGATMVDTDLEGPGTYTVNGTGASTGVNWIGDVPVTFDPPEPAKFMEALLAAANGICAPGGPDPAGEAYAEIDWAVCGDTPRSGLINVVANGNCELVSPE
jgi:hypothetical protein